MALESSLKIWTPCKLAPIRRFDGMLTLGPYPAGARPYGLFWSFTLKGDIGTSGNARLECTSWAWAMSPDLTTLASHFSALPSQVLESCKGSAHPSPLSCVLFTGYACVHRFGLSVYTGKKSSTCPQVSCRCCCLSAPCRLSVAIMSIPACNR